jgi:quercetin dioxygenase-like cupin family protein
MKLIKTFYLITIIGLLSSHSLMAQAEIFPKGEKAPNVHHTGDVWLNHLADADENFDFNVVQATMAAGSKLNWHLHPKGQQLYITNGVGYYQEKGKEVQVVKQGDVVKCEPEVEHWHAATPNTPVTYIAISGNAPTKWTDTLTAETYNAIKAPELSSSDIEKEIKELSKKKWDWMADKDVEKLEKLFHDKAKFVHMSGSWKKDRELEIIETGSIWYKKAEVHDVAVETFGDDTAVLWNRITLTAHVRGNDVSNEFTVTEFYKKEGAQWKLLDLTFSSVRDDHEIQK